MRTLTKVLTGAAAAATALAFVAGTASADPIGNNGKPITPQSYDVVGVGSNTTEYVLDQMAVNYNKTVKTHNSNHPYFFTWDAVKPGQTTNVPTDIVPKAGCKSIVRPNGSTAGLNALDANVFDGKTGHYCIDYARSSSGRSPTAPHLGPGGVVYVAFAKDAVTYATRDTHATKTVPATYAPKNLTTAQLVKIYNCTFTNWKQVGGPNQPIKAFIPQSGSGTRSFWLKQLGLTNPGACVNQSPEENEGLFSGFNSPNAIFPFSVGSYVAQKYHSAACGKKPTSSQNEFGCNETGVLGLNKINGTAPLTTAKVPTINPNFTPVFVRTLYNILRYTTTTKDHILSRLEPFFGGAHAAVKGYLCSTAGAKVIANYGFLATPACGSGS